MRIIRPHDSRRLHQFGDWALYRVLDTSSFLWPRFRLMLPDSAPWRRGQHRTFRLTWSPLELRFARDRYTAWFQAEQPDLYAQVELYMSLNHGPEWLTSEDGAGYTQAEVDEERERLRELRAESKAAKRRGAA